MSNLTIKDGLLFGIGLLLSYALAATAVGLTAGLIHYADSHTAMQRELQETGK